MNSTTNSTGTTKPVDIEEIKRAMASIPAPGNPGVPIAFLLTHIDLSSIKREAVLEREGMTAWLGIPLCVMPGLRVSVALMPDGTTHPIPRKKT